jgi:hypothetical protein
LIVLVNRTFQQGFGAIWILELNDAALNLVALVHQEYIAACKFRSSEDHRIGGASDDMKVRLSLQSCDTAGKVSSLILLAMPSLGAADSGLD